MILLGSTNPFDFVQTNAHDGASGLGCDTPLSHTVAGESSSTPRKHSQKPSSSCRTNPSHRRRNTGLWLRGTVWQVRIRVPADVRESVGRTHVNRSLGTSVYAEAVRKARTVAGEIEGRFSAARASVTNDPDTVAPSTSPRYANASTALLPSSSTVQPVSGTNATSTIAIDLDALADRIAERLSRQKPPTLPDDPGHAVDDRPSKRRSRQHR